MTAAPSHAAPRIATVGMVSFIFLASAILKAASPQAAMLSVEHLMPALPSEVARLIVYGLIIAEIALGALLIGLWRGRVAAAMIGFVTVALSVPLVILANDPLAPSCGCFGLLKLARTAQATNMTGLVRNGLVILACIWLVMTAAPASNPSSQSSLLPSA